MIDLVGSGERVSDAALLAMANMHGMPVSRLHAIKAVEAPRGPFDSQNRITILFEPHIFWRYLPEHKRGRAANEGLACPRWGQIKYGSYSAQYERLNGAERIDAGAAVVSASYGSFQTMGFNFKRCGFGSAWEMINAYRKGEIEHVRAVLKFIKADPRMWAALVNGDWATFARLYNGAGYRKNRYDVKLAAADRLAQTRGHAGAIEEQPAPAADETVRAVQKQLVALGYSVGGSGADGKFGRRTKAAVLEFQRTHPDLHNDGIIGPQTIAALDKAIEAQAAGKSVPGKTGGAVAAGTGAAAAAAGAGLPVWAWAGLLVAGIALAVFLWWRYRRDFAWERNQARNIRDNITVTVQPWADRAHSIMEAL